jgi:hypothetical protein
LHQIYLYTKVISIHSFKKPAIQFKGVSEKERASLKRQAPASSTSLGFGSKKRKAYIPTRRLSQKEMDNQMNRSPQTKDSSGKEQMDRSLPFTDSPSDLQSKIMTHDGSGVDFESTPPLQHTSVSTRSQNTLEDEPEVLNINTPEDTQKGAEAGACLFKLARSFSETPLNCIAGFF